jgi:hypothetical protein
MFLISTERLATSFSTGNCSLSELLRVKKDASCEQRRVALRKGVVGARLGGKGGTGKDGSWSVMATGSGGRNSPTW